MRSQDKLDVAGPDRRAWSGYAIPSRLVPLRWRQVFALYLQYGDEHHASGMAVLRRQVARLFPGSRASFLLVDNALDAATPPRVDGDETRLAGDNANREFSGWDRGLQWLRSSRRVAPNDLVVLANDTFHRSYGSDSLELFRPREIEAPDEFSRRDAPLCERYQGYLKTWGFGEEAAGGSRERWHSQAPLTKGNRLQMRAKARCIFAEHALPAWARGLPVPVIWARSPLAGPGHRAVRSSVPGISRKAGC